MTHRIQKTVIHKFLNLVSLDSASEEEIEDLIEGIHSLYKNGLLRETDLFNQKIEIISGILKKNLELVKRKRTVKETKVEITEDLFTVLEKDLEGIDYAKSNLEEIISIDQTLLEISKDDIVLILQNLVIPKRKLSSEADLEKHVFEQLSKIYGKDKVHRQYSVGGFLALKTDIDVGNGRVGVELKIGDKLNATDMQRLIGQVLYYKNRYYNNNLLVFIASRQEITAIMTELIEFIEELKINVIFNKAINY